MNYWLMKTEPGEFSIDDLARRPNQTEAWFGIRNYQARNLMRDGMHTGDRVFIYHSSCEVPGIVGIARVVREAYPDHTAFEPGHKYFDAKGDPANPRWLMVDVMLERKLGRMITLTELKARAGELEDFILLRRGNRLSILPVSASQWALILSLE